MVKRGVEEVLGGVLLGIFEDVGRERRGVGGGR